MKLYFGINTQKSPAFLIFGALFFISGLLNAQYQSSIIHVDKCNRHIYHSDEAGNRIPDFSYAGYKNGEVDLPVLPVVLTIDPI